MARVSVHHHGSRLGAHGSSALDRTKSARRKKPYKVVMEVVTQEKKKLRSVMTYTANAPAGYTFVPLGNPDLTEYCKESCRRRNLTAHIVTAQPKIRKNSDSNNNPAWIDTQRIGYHFPNQVIDEACDVLGYTWRSGQFIKMSRNYEETRIARNLREYDERMRLDGRPLTERDTKDQIRSAIREVFPKVPDADMDGIIAHAFEEGTNRVGNAKDLTLARRVQLAVGAYIRHQYTQYDTILKTGGTWPEARQRVQSIIYSKLREWRDEADDKRELEETFREIIVLDDEDDDDSITSDDDLSSEGRDHSLEIVSSQATARELQPESFPRLPRVDGLAVSRAPRRLIYLRPAHSSSFVDSLNVHAHAPRQVTRVRTRPTLLPAETVPYSPSESSYLLSARHTQPQRAPPAPRSPKLIQDEDGQWYSLEPIPPAHRASQGIEYVSSSSSTPHYPPRPVEQSSYQPPSQKERLTSGLPQSHIANSHVSYVRSPQRLNSIDFAHTKGPVHPQPLSRASGSDVVLPSVEREAQPSFPGRPQEPLSTTDRFAYRHTISRQQSVAESPKRKAFPESVYEPEDPRYDYAPKRFKPSDSAHTQQSGVFQRLHDREPMDHRAIHRVAPPYEVVDLASSPQRPAESRRGSHLIPVPSHAVSAHRGHEYVFAQPHGYSTRLSACEERYVHPSREPLEPVYERPRYADEGDACMRSGFRYNRANLY